MINRLVIKWAIPSAIFLAASALIIGVVLGIQNDPAWLGRMGSVVIVIGVLLAAIRLDERIPDLVEHFLSQHMPVVIESRIDQVKRTGGGLLSQAEVIESSNLILEDVRKHAKVFSQRKHKILRSYEVAIVCLGTLVNGFGEFVLNQVISVSV